MRLADLNPEWVRWEDRIETCTRVLGDPLAWRPGDPVETYLGPRTYIPSVSTLAEAQGIVFDCPVCTSPGHSIQVAFRDRGVLDHHGTRGKDGKPTRWQVVSGTGFHDLTLSPSIDLTPWKPTCWHGHIKNGAIE